MRVSRALAASVAAMLLAGLVIVAPTYAATIRNVPADYATITAALAASSSGDTVLVAPGTYADGLFTVPSGVTVESSGGADVTFVDGVDKEPIATINAGGIVRGLTLMNADADGGDGVDGAAARVAGLLEDSRLINNTGCPATAVKLLGGTVQHSYFEGNTANCSGSTVVGGTGFLLGNEFAHNIDTTPLRIEGDSSVIEGNYFHDPGSVIQAFGTGEPVIRNNLFVYPLGGGAGPMIWLEPAEGAEITLVNNTIVAWEVQGTLIDTRADASTVIANNVVVGMSGARLLDCFSAFGDSLTTFEANDFWTPSGSGLFGECTSGVVGTSGNVAVDPRFVSPDTGDFHLRADSPLIDAGVNGPAPSTDFDGDSRPLDGNESGGAVVDIGFDETTLVLGLAPDSIDFGSVPLGAVESDTVTATNLGSAPMTIDDISIDGTDASDFDVATEDCTGGTIAAGSSCTIDVEFSTMALTGRSAELTVGGPGNTGSLVIPLTGSGESPLTVTPESFDYPNAIVGDPITGDFITVENAGGSITITDLATAGTNAEDVTIGAETCTDGPLGQGESCVIPFTYLAPEAGSRTAQIEFSVPSLGADAAVVITAAASHPDSGISWANAHQAGGAYIWNGGGALGRTVQSGTQRLHLAYATNRINGEWATNSGPKVGVYYIRSTSGSSWSTPFRLNPKTQHASVLGLAASGSRVYAVWVSRTKWQNYSNTAPRVLYVRVNKAHGAKTEWKSTKALTSSTGRVDYPVVTAAGTDVHIAYTNGNSGDVYVASSRDRGGTWTKTKVGSTSISFSDGKTAFPTISAYGTTVAVCWLSDTFGTVKCRVSTNRGVSWGSVSTVGSESTGYFSVAVRDTRVAVVWATPTDIVLAQRNSGVWSAPTVVPSDQTEVEKEITDRYGPQVALQDPNRIGIAWTNRYGTTSNLHWIETANGGGIWHFADTIGTSRQQDWPSVVWASAGTRYVVWNAWDEINGGYEIWGRRGDGTPSVSAALVASLWVPGERQVTVGEPAAAGPPAE